jgi:8-oxo-dGTP pyrophosphatase MutT (NUDIX family)
MKSWFKKLELELTRPLPGVEAQLRMAPDMRRPEPGDLPLRNGGVLILVYPHRDKLSTVLIKRTEYDGIHSGQVSFPGGMYEEEDGSLLNTALREAREETGIEISSVRVIGPLTPLHIPVSNVIVHAFVGVTHSRPKFNHDPVEVQYLIEESIHKLLNKANQKTKIMLIAGKEVIVPYFDMMGDHVWGATAMILSEFLEVIGRSAFKF